jgi:predicted membrane protein
VTSQDFQGGEVAAIFGGMELDLRDAGLAGGRAVIDATVICGGIEVRVPKDWRVNIQTTTLFGGTESKRSQPGPEDARGELTITGTVLCGGIEVKD